jgi:aminoglycoside phosphotransferase (APT) family kinase protein
MSEAWAAEQRIDEELAAAAIGGQFPQLASGAVELLSEGWDYAVFLVGGTWVFRFPRRAVVVPGTERELAVLPRLASRMPVAVPVPTHVGRPSDLFPWPFYGARRIPGDEAVGLDDGARTRLARPLARALRALHAPETLERLGPLLHEDPIRRADMGLRVPRTRDALAAIADLWRPPPLVEELLAAAAALPPAEPAAVVHGDLHLRQLLVDRGELSGIVDWVDVCRSDPGVDLQLHWSALPPGARGDFLGEYGAVAGGSLLRARVLALFLNAVLARYGRDERMSAVEAEALASLDRTVLG